MQREKLDAAPVANVYELEEECFILGDLLVSKYASKINPCINSLTMVRLLLH